jgi:hypothetical protein
MSSNSITVGCRRAMASVVSTSAQGLVREFLRRHRDRAVALVAGNREHRCDEAQVLARPAILADDQRFEFVELLFGRVVAREAQGALEIVDDRVQRAVGVVGRAMEAQAGCVIGFETPAQLAQHPALADARLAGKQHHLAFAILRQLPALDQQAEFVLAADKTGQPAAAHGFEAALGCRYPRDRPGLDRLGQTLDRVPAECLQPKQIADEPARGGADHHGARLGQGLQPRRQVRRLADHRLLLRGALADQIADHHETGRYAGANLQLVPGRPPAQGGRSGDGGHIEPADCGNDIEAGAHGALGIFFVGVRKAEIDEHAVAHVFGDEPVVAANRLRHTGGRGAGASGCPLSDTSRNPLIRNETGAMAENRGGRKFRCTAKSLRAVFRVRYAVPHFIAPMPLAPRANTNNAAAQLSAGTRGQARAAAAQGGGADKAERGEATPSSRASAGAANQTIVCLSG